MQNKSHAAILKIAKREAQARGYRGNVKSYKLDMENHKPELIIKMEDGQSFSLEAESLKEDDEFMDAARETKRLS